MRGPAKVIRLVPPPPPREPEDEAPGRVPLVLRSTPGPGGAVSILVGDEADGTELWLSPEQAREVACDLLNLAAYAECEK